MVRSVCLPASTVITMVRKYDILAYNHRDRKLELDMTGCECLGHKPPSPKGCHPREAQTICFGCRRPTGKCEWLLEGIPYKGSKYYWWEPIYSDHCRPYIAYIITSCPNYIAPE